MRHRRNRQNVDGESPFIDPDFARALDESSSYRKSLGAQQRRQNHKDLMLCRQAQRALMMALGCETDEALRDAYVAHVSPAPDATHLLVHIAIPRGASVPHVLARLEAARPRLRAQVAQVITRKRAPELSFIVATPPPERVRP
jgi:ribosome-binding factor A